MNSPNRTSPNTPSGNRASLRDLLRSRQRSRNGVRGNPKSCLPCRERKVKCDKKLPCSTCDKRGHPDLCDYDDKTSRPSLGGATSPARSARGTMQVSGGRSETAFDNQQMDTSVGDANQELGDGLSSALPTESLRVHRAPRAAASTSDVTASGDGSPLFLADASVVNMARRRSIQSRNDPARQSAFETGILPLLGVSEDTHTSLPSYQALPGDQEIIRLFELFRRRVQPFHLITYDLDKVEEKICRLVNARSDPDSGSSSDDAGWLCLLHAILAAGAQFSDMGLEDRIAVTQRHTKQAFDLLRSTDYLARPSKEAVQTLLLLGNVLQNDMKPQAAWVLGGTTIRLAQCLGLHRRIGRPPTSPMPDEETRHLRLAIVWQDSLLALTFGRPPASYEMDFEEDLPRLDDARADGHGLSYLQAMSWLCHAALRHLSSQSDVSGQLLSTLNDIKAIGDSLSPHLIDPKRSKTIPQIQEHYAFELHRHFVISTLCRPCVSSSGAVELGENDKAMILEQFQESLRKSARAYIRLRSIAGHAKRSWAFIHNGLTSVLLLSLMRETRYLTETRTLQDELISSLSNEEGEPDPSTDTGAVGHLSGTLQKALKALKTLRTLAERDASGQNLEAVSNTNRAMPDSRDVRPETMERSGTGIAEQAR
ncbi:Fungal specific transcription factor [Colletotrichum higginsianum IMI 349063]|uniref:Fungal specific transcription factor n=2 Tax=Colletotrichum higginsianum (strain IMI 349063) TaxID=759273 RepID=A0A1B7Y0T9_COLHI|nr:Fungal specific transcription factor [Colletotrichum higginsianum IMI 349063]OBR05624.1 Fungal specific transcription factor [Colletotrichum higginsianum IMI 349063]